MLECLLDDQSSGLELWLHLSVHTHYFNMKIFVLLCALILAISALKPSEAGVNDWHNNNVGEIR